MTPIQHLPVVNLDAFTACPCCGEISEAWQRFCWNCGHKFDRETTPQGGDPSADLSKGAPHGWRNG